jgi:hypothetical protein
MSKVEAVTCSGALMPELAHAQVHITGGPENWGRYMRWDKNGPWEKWANFEDDVWDDHHYTKWEEEMV